MRKDGTCGTCRLGSAPNDSRTIVQRAGVEGRQHVPRSASPLRVRTGGHRGGILIWLRTSSPRPKVPMTS
jgi:hypothetical protein